MQQNPEKYRRPSKRELLAERVRELADKCKLDHWSAFIEPVDVPADIAPAIMTNRPELLKLATPRAMTAEEVGKLYKLLAGYIETNMALKEHTSELSQLVRNWSACFASLRTIGVQIEDFAHFRMLTDDDETQEAA